MKKSKTQIQQVIKQYQKLEKGAEGLSGKLQSDTFTLEVQLNNNVLSIVLKDYIDWKIFANKYTK